MALSFVRRSGDGSTTTFTFSFTGQDEGYINKEDILVEVDGDETPFTLASSNTLEITPAPASGKDNILIRRVMPKDRTYADFRTGNNFGQETLNNSFLQTLYIVQEILDGWLPEDFSFKRKVSYDTDLEMNDNDITGVGEIEGDQGNFGDINLKDRNESAQDILDEAYDWAQYPHNQLVPEGNGSDEYSAYHYSVESEQHMDAAALSESTAREKADEAGQFAADSEGSAVDSRDYRNQARTAKNAAQAAENSSSDNADDALEFRNKAKQWANDNEDSVVESGEYSAKHYAAKASSSASSASSSEGAASRSATEADDHATTAESHKEEAASSASNASDSASNASDSETKARGHRDESKDNRDKAREWAESDEDVEVEAGEYSAKHWALKAEEHAEDSSGSVHDGIREGKKNTSPSEDAVYQEIHNLGSASTKDTNYFATAAQGDKADSALQDASQFATASQGDKADSAVQPSDIGSAANKNTGYFANKYQGERADSALQPGDIAQGGGNSTSKPVSQKAVTDAIKGIDTGGVVSWYGDQWEKKLNKNAGIGVNAPNGYYLIGLEMPGSRFKMRAIRGEV